MIALWVRKVQRRDPDLDRRHHRRRDHRRGDRRARRRVAATTRSGWSLSVPTWPDNIVDTARPSARSASSTCSARSTPVGVARRAAARLHAAAGRLLRHDGHDDRHRRRGRPARRGGHAAERRSASCRRLRRRDRRWRGRRLVQHVLHRVRLGRRRGRPHRPGLRRHRRAVPARHLLRAARRGHPVRGRRPGAGPRRLPDDAAGHRASTGTTSRSPSRRSSRSS